MGSKSNYIFVGKVNVKVLLFPSLVALIIPSCASITDLHNAKPTPRPPAGVFVLELTENCSNILTSSNLGIPIP